MERVRCARWGRGDPTARHHQCRPSPVERDPARI